MTKHIYKYRLRLELYAQVEMFEGAKIIHFGNQYEEPTIWAEVDIDKSVVIRELRIVGTGQSLPVEEKLSYIGTAIFTGGTFVWHLYEVL